MQEGLKNIEESPEGSPENPVKTELVDPVIEENVAALKEMSSGKTAEERTEENVAALEEMHAANLKNVETGAPVKEEKIGTDNIGEKAFQRESDPVEPTAKVEEKPKTPREIVSELKGEISGLDQQIEGAQKRHRQVLAGGAIAEAGSVTQGEVTRLETEKQVKLKELEEAKKQSKDRAFEVLSAPDAMRMSPREVAESFGDFTENEKGERRHLKKESSEMAYKNERERGMTVLVGKEAIEAYRQRAITREEEKIHAEERSIAVATCWDRLSEKEKKQFKAADSMEFKNYLDQKRQKLGISENSFAGLVKMGYKPEAAKVRGWLGRFFGHAVEIPTSNPDIFLSSDGSKDDINKWVESNHNKSAKEDASKRVDLRIIEGRHRLLREKAFCTKQIITQAAESYKAETPKIQETEVFLADSSASDAAKSLARKEQLAKKTGPAHYNRGGVRGKGAPLKLRGKRATQKK